MSRESIDEIEVGQPTLGRPMVSVIIPCYNHGQYLDEAVQSVLEQTYQEFEIIVVDDGSAEENTLQILEKYSQPKTKLLRTSHQGLANARNNGIAACIGKYVLPLDADDKIGSTYLEKAVQVLESRENVGIVYCKAKLFGEASGEWELRDYRFPDILYGNVIFCSAVFRKSDWMTVKGYNPNMIYGWEDYDFWLSLIGLARNVYCIPEVMFFYRRHSNSMITGMKDEQIIYSYAQLFRNHPKLYADNMGILLSHAAQVAAQVAELSTIIQNQAQVIVGLQSSHAAIQSSLSWKITKPLRYAKGVAWGKLGRKEGPSRP